MISTYIITSITSISYRTRCNTSDNGCLDFQNCRYSIYIIERKLYISMCKAVISSPVSLMLSVECRSSKHNCFVLDLQANTDFYSASSLQQKSTHRKLLNLEALSRLPSQKIFDLIFIINS